MKKRRLLEAWNEYREKVIPKGASANQVEETRRAFWGGAGILFNILTGQMSEGDEVTDPDVAVLNDVDEELNEFMAEFRRFAQARA